MSSPSYAHSPPDPRSGRGAEEPALLLGGGGRHRRSDRLFRGTLSEEQLDEAERALLGWFAGAEWGGRLPILVAETLTTSCLHVAVTGVRTAEHALGLLLDALAGTGVPMARAVFARLRADGDRDALVRGMDPGARPQVEYDDPREWWRACFDPNAAPPLSEDRAELARDDNALLESGRTTFAERRGLPLHVRGDANLLRPRRRGVRGDAERARKRDRACASRCDQGAVRSRRERRRPLRVQPTARDRCPARRDASPAARSATRARFTRRTSASSSTITCFATASTS